MINWLKGKKTYIVAILFAALSAARMTDLITQEIYDQLKELLIAGGTATVAAKLNRIVKSKAG